MHLLRVRGRGTGNLGEHMKEVFSESQEGPHWGNAGLSHSIKAHVRLEGSLLNPAHILNDYYKPVLHRHWGHNEQGQVPALLGWTLL